MHTILTNENIVGKNDSHLASLAECEPFGCRLHLKTIEPLKILADAAKKQEYELKVFSGFRSFEAQLSIWNAKASGKRAVLDAEERPIHPGSLNGWDLAQAILRWSALPGASRHHWGTDFDIIDTSHCGSDYQVQLTQQETKDEGVFSDFHRWLSPWLEENSALGFVRPYQTPTNINDKYFGIAPEPWHLSYAPAAKIFAKQFDLDFLKRVIESSDLLLKEVVLDHLDEIYQRFIRVE